MTTPTIIGLVGCGNISEAYLRASRSFSNIEINFCADLDPKTAKQKAQAHGIQALSLDALFEHPKIQIILNLTTPQSHTQINLRALHANKHAYCEKPFGLDLLEAKQVIDLAKRKNLYLGCAPDTFMGAGLQTCRKIVDDGWLGKISAGSATMACFGHESWHPNPQFYYQKGAGPLYDMGPYYITALVNMLGPVKAVVALSNRAREQRIASCPEKRGELLDVEIDTHTVALLEFKSGTLINLTMSFDTIAHHNAPIELHGELASLKVNDPNMFDGDIQIYSQASPSWQALPYSHGYQRDMRSIGLADMAKAISEQRPARASGELAYHVLEVMDAINRAAQSRNAITIKSSCSQPAALPTDLIEGQLD